MRETYVLLFILTMAFITSCSDDTPGIHAPASISEIRSSQIVEGQKFGETSMIGVVVSTPTNTEQGLIAVQQKDAESAILLELVTAVNFDVGEEVDINLKDASLYKSKGELRVRYLSSVQVVKTGKIIEIEPIVTDVRTASASANLWGPVLVSFSTLELNVEGETLAGQNIISDESGDAYMAILSSSELANVGTQSELVALKGIVRITETDSLLIYPRRLTDITVAKEDFEAASKGGYDVGTASFMTGAWEISGGGTFTSNADAKNGSQSIRLQGTDNNESCLGELTMQFDIIGAQGAKFLYGIYPASAEVANANYTALSLEYSLDGGETWGLLGTVEYDINSYVGPRPEADSLREANFKFSDIGVSIDTSQPVRFKVVNSSETIVGSNNKPRLNVDDFTFVY